MENQDRVGPKIRLIRKYGAALTFSTAHILGIFYTSHKWTLPSKETWTNFYRQPYKFKVPNKSTYRLS
ncbi:hypothetical protein SQ11_00930 [Nitrosospira sp. NpAV]|nr:hypothetical protein SQ11_00930 [Nitrosospira sp. NpAV]